jgi:hypothetical protein
MGSLARLGVPLSAWLRRGFEGGGVAFVVAGEAAAGDEPGQGAFDALAAWNDGEAVLEFGFAHDVMTHRNPRAHADPPLCC